MFLQVMAVGAFVNAFLFLSIFDIHFRSPLVPVERRHRLNETLSKAPFKRVVFFSADGLRAETFIRHPEFRPFMRKLIEDESSSSVWGVSDARVPTESRPCHVALFVGVWEDPAAIYTGWKYNPAEYLDSVFNQTNYTVAIGPSDIIYKFSNAITTRDKMLTEAYDQSMIDFSADASLASAKDRWVLNELGSMMKNKRIPETRGQLIIFLHLLSADKLGQVYLPNSIEYNKGMQLVDSIANKTQRLVQDYFKDEDTLFVLTSDHGMSNAGFHGEGSLEETELPFVIWGKGLKNNDGAPRRLQQVDFAALLAGVLGIGYPSNSIGKFPASFWADQVFALEALKANFRQLFELMMSKKRILERSRNFIIPFFKEDKIHKAILNSSGAGKHIGQQIIAVNEAIDVTLEGIAYYGRYDTWLLVFFTAVTTVSWTISVALITVRMSSLHDAYNRSSIIRLDFFVVALLSSTIITRGLIGWDFQRIPYGFFPAYTILILVKLLRDKTTYSAVSSEELNQKGDAEVMVVAVIKTMFLILFLCAIGAETLLNAFEKRWILSIGLILISVWCTRVRSKSCISILSRIKFFVAVALLSVFPLLPAVGGKRSSKRNSFFTTLGPIASIFLAFILLFLVRKDSSRKHRVVMTLQMICLLAVSILIHFPSQKLTIRAAWLSLILSYVLPFFVPAKKTVLFRLICLFLGKVCAFAFISFSYEALLFPCLFLVLLFLLQIEMSSGENVEKEFDLTYSENTIPEEDDLHQALRRAWLNIFFITLSFFGTGNIASISSFDPTITRCFDSIFRSSTTTKVVLTEKIVGPLFLVSCFFRAVLTSKFKVERNFLLVLLLCQVMTVHTIFNVRNEGTWLEIGKSISYHAIACVAPVCMFLLHHIASFFMLFELSSLSTMIRNHQKYYQKLF